MIQYHIKKMETPAEWNTLVPSREQWENLRVRHLEIMNKLGQDGWEYFMSIGPLFYFKRPYSDVIENEEE